MGLFMTHTEVCELLSLSPQTLRELMQDTPPHIDEPWVDVGRGRRHVYRWHLGLDGDRVFQWMKEVREWRATKNEEMDGRSVGVTPTARAAAGKSRTAPRGTRSSEPSSKPTPRDDGGSRKPADMLRLLTQPAST